MMNDISDDVNESSMSIFADDIRILKVINNEEEAELLQSDLDKLYKWAETNNMKFKFELLRYGHNINIKENTNYLTPEAEDLIEEKQVLNFNDHINKVCATVNSKAGLVLRTFQCRKTWFLKLLWKQLIQGDID